MYLSDHMNIFHRTPFFQCTKCGNAFKALQIMHNLQLLSHNYQVVIYRFRTAWYALIVKYHIVSTTPNIHIFLDHLADYFDLANVSLSKVTDELCESKHQFFARRLIRRMQYVKDVFYPNHRAGAFIAVLHHNSYCIIISK